MPANDLPRIVFLSKLDANLQGCVQPVTIVRYRAVAAVFTEWCQQEGFSPAAADEWDVALMEFKVSTEPP